MDYKQAINTIYDVLSADSKEGKQLRLFFESWDCSTAEITDFDHDLVESLLQLGYVEVCEGASLKAKLRLHTIGLEEGNQKQIYIFSDFPQRRYAMESADSQVVWPFLDEARKIIQEIRPFLDDLPGGARVLDLCTGSGAVAIGISKLRPDLDIYGLDISNRAIDRAQENDFLNSCKSKPSNVKWKQGNLFDPVDGEEGFDLIIADPNFAPSPKDNPEGRCVHGGKHGDVLTLKIMAALPKYLKREVHSAAYFLAYSLASDKTISNLKIKRKAPVEEMEFVFESGGEKLWRYGYNKAFQNPMPVQYMIMRLGDDASIESIIDVNAAKQLSTIHEWTSWLDGLELSGYKYLHYVRGIAKWKEV